METLFGGTQESRRFFVITRTDGSGTPFLVEAPDEKWAMFVFGVYYGVTIPNLRSFARPEVEVQEVSYEWAWFMNLVTPVVGVCDGCGVWESFGPMEMDART